MRRLSMLVPELLLARLHLEAARRRQSMAETVRAILDEALPAQPED